ncbi:MAG: arginase [Simkania sp.]|nr:arginase [Simkania sp.]
MNYRLIGAASGWGAQIRECEHGPEILRDEQIVEKLQERKFSIRELKILYPEKKAREATITLPNVLPLIHDFNLHLAKEVETTLESGCFPIVLGGDHSIAVGTWNGAYQFFKKKNELPMGLIWIDAHMDAHTPKTSPSGAWHGMPVAGLLGHGDAALAKLEQKDPVLWPENICLIGTRSFEEGEAQLLKRLNVRIYFEKEVEERGIEEVLKEAIAYVSRQTKVFGVSLDLDVICPEEAPGVGSPEKGGVHAKDLLRALSHLQKNKHFKAFELVEYNPKRNHHKQTAKLCLEILSQVMNSER